MGAMMACFFSDAGYSVQIADVRLGPVDWELVAANDVVMLAVPISAVDDAAERLGPFTRSDGLVIDVSSLKAGPLKAMLDHCRGDVIGTHPLFGPSAGSLKGQIVFICPERGGRWIGWLRSFLERSGSIVVEIDAERHDRLMATVQLLRHMLLLSLGLTLKQTGFDLQSDLAVAGPWFGELVDMLARQLQQPPELYAELAARNAASAEIAGHFLSAAADISAAYAGRDFDKLVGLIREISSYIRPDQALT